MGIVEVDEMFIGGKDKNRDWDKKSHVTGRIGSGKVGVIGAISRKGNVVRGEVQTNNLESFWSLFKRCVMGSFHHVSRKNLPLYLAEFQFRHNKPPRIRYSRPGDSGGMKLKRVDWRALQSKQEHASEPVQLELPVIFF
jgi:hypothetical protein